MPRTKKPPYQACPVARAADIMADRWSVLIVRDAFDGLRRFGEFQKSLSIARNILTDRLHTLVEAGILIMEPASDGSAYQDYVLTAKGEALFPVVVGFRQWAEQYLFRPGEPHSVLVESKTGRPIRKMAPSTRDGRVLGPQDAFVRKLQS